MPPPDIVWADVTALAPELADLNIAAQQLVLDQVSAEVNSEIFGGVQSRADIAGAWLARHLGTMAKRGGGSPLVQSVRAGDVSKTYQATQQQYWRAELSQTRYGMEYLRLCRLWAPRFAAT